MPVAIQSYLVLSAIIFAIGIIGLLIRRNPLILLMSVELLWGAGALAFIAFARYVGNMDGHVFAFFAIIVAAAEVAIGLALVVALFRGRDSVDVDDIQLLKG